MRVSLETEIQTGSVRGLTGRFRDLCTDAFAFQFCFTSKRRKQEMNKIRVRINV